MQDPFVGTWKLNTSKSEFDPNHRPADATMIFEPTPGGGYIMRAAGRKPNGETVAERPQQFDCDGHEHPIPDFPELKATSAKPDAHTIQGEARREDGSVVGGGTYRVSPDAKTLTVTNFGWDAQLRQFKQTTVWDRVK